MSNPSKGVLVVIGGFIALVLGFVLFPGLHTEILTVDTTDFNKIAAGVVALFPYVFIGGIFLGILWLWRRGDS